MKYHVHIYQVAAMTEHDIEAETEQEARQRALDEAKATHPRHFSSPDCKLLAISFGPEKV